jgi:DsbC/DsbD-like thiol-disulfide interchange protein
MMSETTSVRRWLRLSLTALAVAALAAAAGTSATAGDKGKDESHAKVTAVAGKIDKDGTQVVTVTMDIESPWYAYANPVGNDDLESARTKVTIKSANKLEKVDVNYPVGKKKTLGKEQYNAYEGKVEITAIVKRAPGDTSPLDVSVKYMTCHPKGLCLPPEEVKLTVK